MARTALVALTLSGVLPTLAAALLVPAVDAVPGWLSLSALVAALLGAAAWLVRSI